MSEEVFFHYTNKEAAIKTVLQGKILPSALAENSNAVHGDGVYLTTLEPRHGEVNIKNNNYLDGAAANKTNIEVHFEIMMPSSKVQRANDTRDIQVHKGPLLLSDHKWNLKTWAGEVLATQYFMISSDGKARESHNKTMGRYTLVKDICTMIKMNGKEVGRSFVYKHDEGNKYLFYTQMRKVNGVLVRLLETMIVFSINQILIIMQSATIRHLRPFLGSISKEAGMMTIRH